MSNQAITEVKISGDDDDLHALILAMEPALLNARRSHALIALLSLALTIQNPDLTAEQMHKGVHEVSQFMCLWLSSLDDQREIEEGMEPKMLMN